MKPLVNPIVIEELLGPIENNTSCYKSNITPISSEDSKNKNFVRSNFQYE